MAETQSDDRLILEERFPRIAARLGRECADGHADGDIRIALNPRGQPVAQVVREGKELALVSQYDPVRQAETFAASLFAEAVDVFVLCGLALGYYAKALLGRMTARQRLIVVEPSWPLLQAQVGCDAVRAVLADERLSLIVEDDAAHACRNVECIVWSTAGSRIICGVAPAYRELFPAFVAAVGDAVRSLNDVLAVNARSFADGCDEIRKNYFNERGQMGDLASFFERIVDKQQERELTRVEYAYLFGWMMLVHKAYGENAALVGENK